MNVNPSSPLVPEHNHRYSLGRIESRLHRHRTSYLNGPTYGNDSARGILRRHALGNSIIDNAVGFPYFRRLSGHSSCVNALGFSRGDGRWLASGGDDVLILLWDFHQDDVKKPSHTLSGPRGNIFCLEFSASNRFLYAGGTDKKAYKYDIDYLSSGISQSGSALPATSASTFTDHGDTIRALSSHPIHDEVFLSASEDGCIIHRDMRQPSDMVSRPSSILQTNVELSGVHYHPTMEHMFVTSNAKGQVYLHDARMAFSGDNRTRGQQGIVQKYTHLIAKPPMLQMANPEASSITFNKDGSKLAVTYLNYFPVIYSVSDPHPIAVLTGKNFPDGTPVPPNQKTYINSCTSKHGAFGGTDITTGEMYAAGSDDFRNYVWKIPPVQWLLERREQLTAEAWVSRSKSIAFTQGYSEDKYIPYEIATPFCRLTGYKSIVNTSAFHPHLLHLVSSGVEKDVFIHSPTQSSPCTQDLSRAPNRVRQIVDEQIDRDRANYISALLGDGPLYDPEASDADDEETRALSLFDFIIREEGDSDVFTTRRWTASDDSDSSEVSQDDSDDDVYV